MRDLAIRKLGSERELEREAFRMAAGDGVGIRLAIDESFLGELRELWASWLGKRGIVDPKILEVAPGQPLYLRRREFVRAKFEEDVQEGLMEKMSRREFKQRYGEHRAIAALAVIVEDEASGKKRVIHDGVRVNHRIRCRDKLRAPGR